MTGIQMHHDSNGHMESEIDLKSFSTARKLIYDIFTDLIILFNECSQFTKDDINDEENLFYGTVKFDNEKIKSYTTKSEEIVKILLRNRMKVVFFGRTSNGKSTTINAILQDKILPSGIGHTTNCFIQIEGCEENEPYFLEGNSTNKKNITSINQLSSALSCEKISADSILKVFIPKSQCPLFVNDIVLIDSPGIDISLDYDACIENYCLDADLFVLVANSESTLMKSEKNFFHKVSERLSKPLIFILNNRWDASDDELELRKKVKQQHVERNVEFLVKELESCSDEEAKSRVFFISSREMLRTYLSNLKPNVSINSSDTSVSSFTVSPDFVKSDSFIERTEEFHRFLKLFSKCMTRSALRTKVAPHTNNAIQMLNDLLEITTNRLNMILKEKENAKKLMEDRNVEIKKNEQEIDSLKNLETEIFEIHQAISKTLENKIIETKLEVDSMVQLFSRPFHSNSEFVSIYREELDVHVKKCLYTSLMQWYETYNLLCEQIRKNIFDAYIKILNDENGTVLSQCPPKINLDNHFEINITKIMENFHADVSFKFSLSPACIFDRIFKSNRSRILQQPQVEETSTNIVPSKSNLGAAALLALVAKSTGIKFLMVGLSVYGMMYAIEYLTWTNKAKKIKYNQQYTHHLQNKIVTELSPLNIFIPNQFYQDCRAYRTWFINKANLSIAHKLTLNDKLKDTISKWKCAEEMSKIHIKKIKTSLENVALFSRTYLTI